MSRYLKCFIFFVCIVFTGCINIPKEKSVVQSISNKEIENTKNKVKIENIAKVLSAKGYSFEIINENIGVIKTDWKEVTDKMTETSNKTGLVQGLLVKGTVDKSYIYMQLNIKLNKENYILTPKLKTVIIEKGLLATNKREEPYYFDLEQTEYKKQIEQIITDINKELRLENNYQWVINSKS